MARIGAGYLLSKIPPRTDEISEDQVIDSDSRSGQQSFGGDLQFPGNASLDYLASFQFPVHAEASRNFVNPLSPKLSDAAALVIPVINGPDPGTLTSSRMKLAGFVGEGANAPFQIASSAIVTSSIGSALIRDFNGVVQSQVQNDSSQSVLVSSATGFSINLKYDSAALTAPASFRAGIQQAANLLAAAITDKITINVLIDYSGTGGGAAAGPDAGFYVPYSTVRSDLVNNATPGDTTFNSLPNGSSVQGQSWVAVWNAQAKLPGFGIVAANDTTSDDGSAIFATDINPSLLVGVALHELTHALGRIPYGSPDTPHVGDSATPDIFNLFRFTSAGNRFFDDHIPTSASYFSVDGGITKIADYGRTSDPSDFLNAGVQGSNDPFNEFYNSSTLQTLTAVDLNLLDALGFHLAQPDQPPVLSNVAANASYTELASAATLSPGTTIGDPDSTTIASATVSIASGNFTGDGDVLSAATAGTSISSSYNASTEVLTLSGTDTLAHYQQVLDSVVFSSTSHNPTNFGNNTTRTISWVANDGSLNSNTATTTVTITAVDDAPVLSNVAATTSYTELAAPTTLSPGSTVSDVDNPNLVSATVSITGGTFFSGDVLAATTSGTSIAVSYNSSTGVLSLTGDDTLAHYQTVLDSVSYSSTSHNPTNFGTDTSRTISWVANDGSLDSNTAITTVTVIPMNEALSDFNRDGTSDILWRNGAGDLLVERMNSGGTFGGWDSLGGSNSAYTVVGTGDYNGDGTSDVLFRNNSTGDTLFLQVNNDAANGWNYISGSSTDWSIAGTGDFNLDGTSDILWRNGSGDLLVERMNNGGTFGGWDSLGGSNPAYAVVGTGDYNGDGTSDVLFRNNSTGDTLFLQVNNDAPNGWHSISGSSTAWSIAGTGDFNHDGTSDILWRNGAGDLLVERMNSGGTFGGWDSLGGSNSAYTVVGTGDYNGDGTPDVLFRNNSTGDTLFLQVNNDAANGWHPISGSSTAYSIK